MTTPAKKKRFMEIDDKLYPYIDATVALQLWITDPVRRKAEEARADLERRIAEVRSHGLPTQYLEDQRGDVCHLWFALTDGMGAPWARVLTRTTLVLLPNKAGELEVNRFVHGADTTRFIQDVDKGRDPHTRPIELSPPTPGRTMDMHAQKERERKARLGAKPQRKNGPRSDIQVGLTFPRGGAYVVTRMMVRKK